MPWRDMSPMDQRMQFVTEDRSGLFTMTELATQDGISRRTGYKWVDRYDAAGVVGLLDHRAARIRVRGPPIRRWSRRWWPSANGTRAGGAEIARGLGASRAAPRLAESIDRLRAAEAARIGHPAAAPRPSPGHAVPVGAHHHHE